MVFAVFTVLVVLFACASAWEQVIYPPAFTTNETDKCEGLLECNCQTRVNNDLTLTLVRCTNDAVPEMHLKNQGIQSILPGAFETLTDLRILDMTGNLLNTLEPETFKGLGKLETLNLRNNEFYALTSESFKGLTTLRFLYLTQVGTTFYLTDMPHGGMFSEMPLLEHFRISKSVRGLS